MIKSDILSESDRYRVFNLFVVPYLSNKKIFKKVTKDNSYILFNFCFDRELFKFDGVHDLETIHDLFKKADATGSDHYVRIEKQLGLNSENINDKLYVCVFHYAPRHDFNPSVYSFEKSIMSEWNDSVQYDTEVGKSVYNEFFSNRAIKEMIDWKILKKNISFFLDVPPLQIPIMMVNLCKEEEYMCHIDTNKFFMLCGKALVPTDMQKLVESEHNRKNCFLVQVINYLQYYFLIVRMNKNSNDTYEFEFVSSPNDHSLDS